MDGFLTKPLKRAMLLRSVAQWAGVTDPTAGSSSLSDDISKNEDEAASPMNFEQALAEFMGRADLLVPVVREFVANGVQEVQHLQQYLKAGDAAQIAEKAHSIKGAAANLTAFELADTAKKVEMAGLAVDISLCGPLIKELDSAYERLREFVDRQLATDISC